MRQQLFGLMDGPRLPGVVRVQELRAQVLDDGGCVARCRDPVFEVIDVEALRVAFAANRGESLDGHFGSCERFLVYQVSTAAIRLIDIRTTVEADTAEDRNAARSALINDCQILGVQSIGGPAAAKVVRAGVHPVKRPIGGEARDMLAELQGRLLAPPPWLAQIMGVPAHSLAKFEADMEEIEP